MIFFCENGGGFWDCPLSLRSRTGTFTQNWQGFFGWQLWVTIDNLVIPWSDNDILY